MDYNMIHIDDCEMVASSLAYRGFVLLRPVSHSVCLDYDITFSLLLMIKHLLLFASRFHDVFRPRWSLSMFSSCLMTKLNLSLNLSPGVP
jgi:hypothetical protein